MWLKAKRINLNQIDELPKRKYRRVGKYNLAYREIGAGFPVFCIPSWPQSSTEYIPLAIALKEHLQLICVELPGWAGKSGRLQEPAEPETYARIISEFIKGFEFTEYGLLGYSFGGVFAQAAIQEFGLRPKKLALLSTLHSGKRLAQVHRKLFSYYNLAKKLHIPSFVIKKAAKRMLLNEMKSTKPNNKFIDTLIAKEEIRDTKSVNIRAALDLVENLFTKSYLGNMPDGTELLVMYAEGDREFFKTEAREIATAANVEPVVFDRGDHDQMFFAPNKATDLILNFFAA